MSRKTTASRYKPQNNGEKPKQVRLTAKTRQACILIALHGASQRDAAREAGMDESSLSRALRQPHVAEFLDNQRKKAFGHLAEIRRAAEVVAIETAIALMKGDAPPAVKHKLVELFTRGQGQDVPAAVQIVNNAASSEASGYTYQRPASPTTDGQSVTNQRQPIEIEGKASDV